MSEEPEVQDNDEDVDSCDCPFDVAVETLDEDLPAADGGVA